MRNSAEDVCANWLIINTDQAQLTDGNADSGEGMGDSDPIQAAADSDGGRRQCSRALGPPRCELLRTVWATCYVNRRCGRRG